MQQIQEKIFSTLKISKHHLLNEISIILAKQQMSEYLMEIEYFENKYNKDFEKFDNDFKKNKASYEMEDDWLKWKFSVESRDYWQTILE